MSYTVTWTRGDIHSAPRQVEKTESVVQLMGHLIASSATNIQVLYTTDMTHVFLASEHVKEASRKAKAEYGGIANDIT